MLFSETLQNITMINLAPWVVLLPAVGLLVNMIVGKRLGEAAVGIIASLAVAGAFGVSVIMALTLQTHPEAVVIPFLEWISIGDFSVGWEFRVDTLSVMMMLVVSGVGTLIHIYAAGYMHKDVRHNGDPARYARFFIYFNLFIMAMMILVSANNFLMLFVGWEGVGLCSYLLIGFWFEKGAGGIENAIAAKKAFIVNRVGDFGLLIAMFLIYWQFGSLSFSDVFDQAAVIAAAAPGVMLAITLFILLGVTGKSAQLPLHVWLPDAMAGPTPVSALIHAATMVTAGVYLIARSAAFYVEVPLAQSVVVWVGTLTALFAATIAVGQNDIKKVLAYSTISQLGFMVAAVGTGAFVAGLFHLVTHAFFKALLFLSAGSVILGIEHGVEDANHSRSKADHTFDPQDMRNMGGLRKLMPVTFWVYMIGGITLAGIAPLAGFFSKDEILAAASKNSPVVYGLLLMAAFMTAFYIGRQIVMVFFGKPRSIPVSHAWENKPIITVPLIMLALLSILGGVINFPGLYTLDSWLEHTIENNLLVQFSLPIALTSMAVAVIGLMLAWLAYGRRPADEFNTADPLIKRLGVISRGIHNGWWVDNLYHAVLVRPYRQLSRFLANTVDNQWIDGIVNGFGYTARTLAQFARGLQTGYARTYVLSVLFGLLLAVTYLVFR